MKRQPSRACKRTDSYSSEDEDYEDQPAPLSCSRCRLKSNTGGKESRKDLIVNFSNKANTQSQHKGTTSDSDDNNNSSSEEQLVVEDEEDE